MNGTENAGSKERDKGKAMLEVQIRKDGVLTAIVIASRCRLIADRSATWEAKVIYPDGRVNEHIANAPRASGNVGVLARILELETKELGDSK